MSKGDVEILDFGCGTGLVGQCLNEMGYSNISNIFRKTGVFNWLSFVYCRFENVQI